MLQVRLIVFILCALVASCAPPERQFRSPMSYSAAEDGFSRHNGHVLAWPSSVRTVEFAFDPDFPSRFIGACYAAADTWNVALGREFIVFTDERVPYRVQRDRRNVISMGKSQKVHAPNHAAETSLLVGDFIVEADIDFDTRKFKFGTSRAADEADVESVCLHELGHALGLGHDLINQNSVMSRSMTIGTQKRRLDPVDVARLHALYPPPVRTSVSALRTPRSATP